MQECGKRTNMASFSRKSFRKRLLERRLLALGRTRPAALYSIRSRHEKSVESQAKKASLNGGFEGQLHGFGFRTRISIEIKSTSMDWASETGTLSWSN